MSQGFLPEYQGGQKPFIFLYIILKRFDIEDYDIYKMRPYIFSFLFVIILASYQPKVSRQLAVYSIIVYQSEQKLQSWTCQYCDYIQKLIDISFFKVDSHNLLAMVAYSSKLQAIVVVFRGTSIKSKANVLTDLNYQDVAYPNCQGCQVHKGIYRAFIELKDLMINSLQQYTEKYPTSQIYITGHSLGGALASLAAAELANHDEFQLGNVYTYGKPRVGNKKYADWFNSLFDAYRVVHYHDIVPSLPPRSNPITNLKSKVVSELQKIKVPKIKFSSLFGHYSALRHDLSVESHQSLLNFEYYHEGILIMFSADMKTYKICDGEADECFKSIKVYNPHDHFKKYYVSVPSTDNPVSHFQAVANGGQTHMKMALSSHD